MRGQNVLVKSGTRFVKQTEEEQTRQANLIKSRHVCLRLRKPSPPWVLNVSIIDLL